MPVYHHNNLRLFRDHFLLTWSKNVVTIIDPVTGNLVLWNNQFNGKSSYEYGVFTEKFFADILCTSLKILGKKYSVGFFMIWWREDLDFMDWQKQ